MELILEIVNTELVGPSQQLRKVFERTGGVIGRQEYSAWVIVDPAKQVSRCHAYVSYNGTHFYLKDASTNGTRLKATGERLRPGIEERIEDGAVYMIGLLEIRAQIVRPAPSVLVIPEDFDFGQLPVAPVAAADHIWATPAPELELQQHADYAPIDREHLVVPTLVAPLSAPDPVPELVPLQDQNDAFWRRFALALGINIDDLNATSRETLAVETARLFKLSIGNLQQSLRTRTELKNEMRLLLTTGQYIRKNPIKHADTPSEAVRNLLLDGQNRPNAEQVISRSFNDLQAHQVAMLGASRAALRSTLEHFSPQHLALRFEREGHKPMFATDGGLWRAYVRYHQALAQDDDWSERLLARDFAQAYEEQVRLINSLHTDSQG